MEPNSPISTQQETNNQKPQSRKKVVLLIAIGVLVVIVIALAAYYVMNKSDADDVTVNTTNNVTANVQNSSNVSNTSTNNTTGSAATSDMKTYTNTQYKFSLNYPKTYQDYGNCDDVKKVRDALDNNQPRPTVSDVAVKVFEVPGENKVYLAPEKTVEINMYQVGQTGVYNFDYSSCKMVNTTLDLIQKWDDKLGDNMVARPTMLEMPFQINFTWANSDVDLVDFFDSVSFKPANPLKKSGCVVKRSAYENSAGVFRITIEGGEACYPVGGSPSIYLYSPTTKTALLASFQILPFGLKEDFIQFAK